MVTIWFFLLAISSLGRLVGSDTFTVGYLAGITSDIKNHKLNIKSYPI